MLYRNSFISITFLLIQWLAPSVESFSGISPQEPVTTTATNEKKIKNHMVYIRASKLIDQPVSIPPPSPANEDGTCCLTSYMQLPAAQYACVPMPLNASLTRLVGSKDKFKLCVPPMTFRLPGVINLEVVPEVKARVDVQKDRVLISADECTIHGSPLIESLDLNERFDFSIRCCMTWGDLSSRKKKKSNKKNKNDGEISSSAAADATKVSVVELQEQRQIIRANTTISVDFDPPGFLKRIPKQATETVGNAAFALTMSRMLSQFMKSLAADFQKWNSDEEYRLARKQMELDLLVERDELNNIQDAEIMQTIEKEFSSSSTVEDISDAS
mmetsp:Transcript_7009/g.9897  ORF Transcript_7009/g.9897 Transcript_7009/m.9897 type:complete len:329 (+) Transcript_7009:199-1185(+)